MYKRQPITYKINGKQYIAILVGWGGAFAGVGNKNLGWDYNTHMRRLLVFTLYGKTNVPSQPPKFYPKAIVDTSFKIDLALAKKGRDLYWRCFNCHGANAMAKGMAPDLRASPIPLNKSLFKSIVHDGIKMNMGMPVYDELTDDDLEALRHFIRLKSNDSEGIRIE